MKNEDKVARGVPGNAPPGVAATANHRNGPKRSGKAPNGEAPPETRPAPSAPGASKKIPPGEVPLPANPGEFVEEIHKRMDLFRVWQGLLENEDSKIKQRAVERLTDLRYKGAAALEEEPQQIVIDIDSAVARRAAEGARK